ncbi:hypothetical protein B0T24DRAFT_609307 [Lasiosphaeria ovina]|uniref:Nucleoside phosphorylase domain-containing protein n=1 Tax=Lasiosphaeria ovina TaxID=92902 RepID=A0AAE0NNA6_9PEZI|nr:hypothetical protein B0T24DRAFT_609307 [Lasiosphaeria ovina]
MPTPPLRRDNGAKERPAGRHGFEIAIFCALPLESSALSYLFDQFFDDDGNGDPYQKVEGDPNHYTTGRIGRHNVVLVLLPGMGKALAASAAASLRASYPNVRVALVVGICGGVPGPLRNGDDIFLGDVVISNSIVQYDLGRQYPNGVFARKKSLHESHGRPNKDIRALLKSFETDRNRDKLEQRTAHYLRELQTTYAQRTKRKPAKYKYPGTDEDELFQANYRHRHRFSSCCNQDTTCDKAIDASCDELGCEDRYLVDRDGLAEKRRLEEEDPAKAQEPAIYIGPVASGDTVMKSGEDRDRIAREEGILAFEMEGAGVWDEIPCIVVKSVCDYADSHKRKRWQEFAAATAASAAKALLEALVVVDRTDGLVSRREMLAVLELFRCQGRIPLGDSRHDFGELVQSAVQNRPVSEVQFHSVLVIDARGRLLPFHLETINSKELFLHILRARFKDLGHTKIDRGEWSLEDTQTGEILDLDKPWQTVVKHNQVIRMSMDFRRRNVPTTECPSCGFMSEGLPTDQVECSVCGLTYCRIEEIQEIEVRDEAPNSAPAAAEPRHDRPPEFPRPRPPIQVPADQDIRHYKQVRIIDTSFRIRRADGSDVLASRATFSTRHLVNTELLAEELAKRYGLPEEDCMRVLAESASQLSALRTQFLDRNTLRGPNRWAGRFATELDVEYVIEQSMRERQEKQEREARALKEKQRSDKVESYLEGVWRPGERQTLGQARAAIDAKLRQSGIYPPLPPVWTEPMNLLGLPISLEPDLYTNEGYITTPVFNEEDVTDVWFPSFPLEKATTVPSSPTGLQPSVETGLGSADDEILDHGTSANANHVEVVGGRSIGNSESGTANKRKREDQDEYYGTIGAPRQRHDKAQRRTSPSTAVPDGSTSLALNIKSLKNNRPTINSQGSSWGSWTAALTKDADNSSKSKPETDAGVNKRSALTDKVETPPSTARAKK